MTPNPKPAPESGELQADIASILVHHKLGGPWAQYRQEMPFAADCGCGETFFANSEADARAAWEAHISHYLAASLTSELATVKKRLESAERECQSVWRCAIGDVTGALDVLKNRWINSRRKHEREAGEELNKIASLIWAARSPAASNYDEAAKLGKALTERARTFLQEQEKQNG